MQPGVLSTHPFCPKAGMCSVSLQASLAFPGQALEPGWLGEGQQQVTAAPDYK